MPVVPHPINMKKEEEEKAFKLYVNFFKGRRRKLIGKYLKHTLFEAGITF